MVRSAAAVLAVDVADLAGLAAWRRLVADACAADSLVPHTAACPPEPQTVVGAVDRVMGHLTQHSTAAANQIVLAAAGEAKSKWSAWFLHGSNTSDRTPYLELLSTFAFLHLAVAIVDTEKACVVLAHTVQSAPGATVAYLEMARVTRSWIGIHSAAVYLLKKLVDTAVAAVHLHSVERAVANSNYVAQAYELVPAVVLQKSSQALLCFGFASVANALKTAAAAAAAQLVAVALAAVESAALETLPAAAAAPAVPVLIHFFSAKLVGLLELAAVAATALDFELGHQLAGSEQAAWC